jgi:hypothetical protein
LLRDVLSHSANAEHRALAAELLGYAPHVSDVLPDLENSIHDSTVLDSAARMLGAKPSGAMRHHDSSLKSSAMLFARGTESPALPSRVFAPIAACWAVSTEFAS